MITYELALQLKNAGFPQEFKELEHFVVDDPNVPEEDWEYFTDPTLSQLIESCGEVKKFIFENQPDGRKTLVVNGKGYGPYNSFEECCAYLWLELNKK